MKFKLTILFLMFVFLSIGQSFSQENEKEKYIKLIEKFKNLSYGQWQSMTGQFNNAGDAIYEPLIKLLRKEETGEGAWRRIEWNQRRVAWILGDVNTQKSANYLIQMIQDTTLNLWGRIEAVQALGSNNIKKAADSILEIFQNRKNDPQFRRFAARALGDLKVEKSVPFLKLALNENINLLDMGVLNALGKIGTDEAVDALFYALDRVVFYNRPAIYNSLRTLRHERELEFLFMALDDSYWGVREEAVKILKEKGITVSGQLRKIVENEESTSVAVWEAIRILGTFKQAELSDLFLNKLNHTDWMVRNEAAVALTKINSENLVDSLIRLLNSEDDIEKEEAAWILGEISSEQAIEPLIKLLDDKYTGWMAAISLGKIGAKEALQPLMKNFEKKDVKTKRAFVWSLEKLKSEQSIPIFKKALKDEDEEVRTLAALALENMKLKNE